MASLKTFVRQAFRTFKEESAIMTCRAFRARIVQVVDVEGGDMESNVCMAAFNKYSYINIQLLLATFPSLSKF